LQTLVEGGGGGRRRGEEGTRIQSCAPSPIIFLCQPKLCRLSTAASWSSRPLNRLLVYRISDHGELFWMPRCDLAVVPSLSVNPPLTTAYHPPVVYLFEHCPFIPDNPLASFFPYLTAISHTLQKENTMRISFFKNSTAGSEGE